MTWELEGIRQRGIGCPKKTSWDCVKDDMESLGLSQKYAQFTNKWRKRIKGQPANPGSPGKWPLKCLCVFSTINMNIILAKIVKDPYVLNIPLTHSFHRIYYTALCYTFLTDCIPEQLGKFVLQSQILLDFTAARYDRWRW